MKKVSMKKTFKVDYKEKRQAPILWRNRQKRTI